MTARTPNPDTHGRQAADAVIDQALYCHLACSRDGQPYGVPLAFGYDGRQVFFHSAASGKKLQILRENPRVSLTFVVDAKLVRDPNLACNWDVHYRSVVAEGRAEEILGQGEKTAALEVIMGHYSDQSWSFSEAKLQATSVWKVQLDVVTEKRSPAE